MEANAKINSPGDVEITLTVTMSLDEWKLLDSQLSRGEGWNAPSAFISNKVKMLTRRFEEKVHLNEED